MSQRLASQVALITGGTSGIGRGIAQRFVAEGARVAVLGRNLETLQKLSEELGPNLLAVQGDVTNQTDLENFFASAHSKFGALNILVCSAGIGYRLTLDQATLEEFDHTFNVDVRSIFSMVKIAAKHLQPEKSSILLISSIAGHITFANHVIYSSAKAAVTKMTANFAMDLAAQGIRVNAISPGFIETPIFDSLVKNDPQFFEKISSTVPLQRMGQPEDIAQAACFLCSNEASYITGVDLLVDGGFSHQRMLPSDRH